MKISDNADYIIGVLENAGYQAYAVGGCVRDFIMSRSCDDVDITTSAKPNETEKVLAQNNIPFFETGLKHGTVTAVVNNENFEITTFRIDGEYKDSRHPDKVEFVNDLSSDLARRDFTVNAMAFNKRKGIVDLYGGRSDIEKKIIRTVGNPDERFREDALRIMRALRFSSTLSFDIEPQTKKAVFKNKDLLRDISSERIFAELSKLLLGDNVFNVLVEYKDVIAVVIPELEPIFNVEQNTVWHIYNTWVHTAKAVEKSPCDLSLRLAMLLHDIGKAFTKTTDQNGCDHFKGHQKISAHYADIVLKRLKASNEIYNRVMTVIPIHDIHIGTQKKNIKKLLSKIGEDSLRDLIEVKRADKLAQNPEMTAVELENLDITQKLLDTVIDEGEPISVKDLAVNGFDLISLGYRGKEIGDMLKLILLKVIDESLPNDKNTLIKFAENEKNQHNQPD